MIPWKDHYYGPAIAEALGLDPTASGLYRQRDGQKKMLGCWGIDDRTLLAACEKADHMGIRARIEREPSIQERIQALESKVG